MFVPWELDLFDSARVARLATIAPDGRAHLVPVCYAFADGRFAIAIDEKPKSGRPLARLRNIQGDHRVSLLIDRYDDDWSQLAWVRVDGEAAVHERGESWAAGLVGLRERYQQYGTMALESLPLIEVQPTAKSSWRWAQP